MKILQIIQKSQLRGAEMFSCQLSETLVKKGHQINILVLTGEKHQLDDFDLNFIFLKANLKKRFFDFSSFKKLSKIVKNGQYDIVQANAGDTLKYAVLSKKLYHWKAPIIFRNASTLSNYIRKNYLKKLLNQYFLSNIQHIVSVSNHSKEDIIKLFPNLKDKTTAIPIGTYNFENVKPFTTNSNDKIIIHLGSFVWEKNHNFLIDIFYNLLKKDKNYTLWLVGNGKLINEIENKVEALKIKDKVKFWGYRKDVISLLKASDILLLPSKNEGLPGVILEAMSCEVPVIASNVGGIPEVVINDYNGYVLDDFNKNEYVEKVELVLNNSKLKQQLGKNGQELFRKQYEMTKIANQFEALYKKVLNEEN